ncbi:MAG: prepilin peptidase [Fuerstiella sp.]|nr:prepilin peptidase [Fuerstiella sp.]
MKTCYVYSADRPPVLYSEYLRMLVIVHAVFIAVACLAAIERPNVMIIGITTSAWITLRSIRGVTWRWYFPLVNLTLLGLVTWSLRFQQPINTTLFSDGIFSLRITMVLLGLFGCVDLAEIVFKINRLLQTPDSRTHIHAGLVRHGTRCLQWGTTGFILIYSIIVPLVEEAAYLQAPPAPNPNLELDRLSLLQNMLFRFCESMSAIWFFVIGSCVGSFMNVVIYRVPLGISVLAKSSHCPQCSAEILSSDNLPLIGWLKLHGQCRNCQTMISARYPLVELTIGLLFLLLYFVELITGGTNLPGRPPNTYAGVLWILFYTKWDLVGLYLFHCFVICATLCWTMMERDEKCVPSRAIVITLTLVTVVVLTCPHLLPFTFDIHSQAGGPAWRYTTKVIMPLLNGALTGLVAGYTIRRLVGVPQHLFTWVLAGLALGWQAIVMISVLCATMKLILYLTMLLTDEDSSSEDTGMLGPPGEDNLSNSGVMPAWSLSMAERTGAAHWWLFPTVLVIHQCLWRQLAFISGGIL